MPTSKALEAWFEEPGFSGSMKKALRAERYVSGLGGGLLAAFGLSRRSLGGALLAATGAALVVRGIAGLRETKRGRLLWIRRAEGARVHGAVTILKDPGELYERCKSPEEISRLMKHVQSIRSAEGGDYKILARLPIGRHVEWGAHLQWHDDERRITWGTKEGTNVRHLGSLVFSPAPQDRGTELRVILDYEPTPRGVGIPVPPLVGGEITSRLSEDLRRYKQILECGEVATTRGQSSGRMTARGRRAGRPASRREIPVRQPT
ncbi:MAG: hypothetical protein ACOC0J_02975, partial [Myxococcota bacterium]